MDCRKEKNLSLNPLISDNSQVCIDEDKNEVNCIIHAVNTGNLIELKIILDGKNEEEIRRLVKTDFFWNFTILQYCAISFYCYRFEMDAYTNILLSEHGCNIKKRTLLTMACYRGFRDVAEYLIVQCKVDVNQPDGGGFPALWHAVSGNHIDTVKMLLKLGATISASTAYTSALHLACFRGYFELVEILLEHVEDMTLIDKFGKTPILAATLHQHTAIVNHLCKVPKVLMPDDKVNAYQLLGSIFWRDGDTSEAMKFWKLAISEKINRNISSATNDNSPSPKPSPFACNYVKEIDDMDAIDELWNDCDKRNRQNILIFHKILGPLHNFTTATVTHCAEEYIHQMQIDYYIELWDYLSNMQDIWSVKLFHDELITGIGSYIGIASNYFPIMCHHDLIKIFVKAVSEVKRLKLMITMANLSNDDIIKTIVNKEFELILSYTLHIAVIILQKIPQSDDDEYRRFFQAVYKLVRINAKGVMGRTLIHLCHCKYSKKSIVMKNYDKTYNYIETTSLKLTKILLQAGANPDEMDDNRSTPLHYAAVSFPNNTDFAALLLEAGAHLDSVNSNHATYEQLLDNKLLFNLLSSFSKPTLMCLAAHVLNGSKGRKYQDMIPPHLRDFVDRHA